MDIQIPPAVGMTSRRFLASAVRSTVSLLRLTARWPITSSTPDRVNRSTNERFGIGLPFGRVVLQCGIGEQAWKPIYPTPPPGANILNLKAGSDQP